MDPGHTSKIELASRAARHGVRRAERWGPVPAAVDRAVAADAELARAAREARRSLVADLRRRLGSLDPRYVEAVLATPRERFVLPGEIARSAEDAPSPLDEAGLATVSAPHAYLLTYGLLGLTGGDHLLELGTGTGYGAALARAITGERGHVTTIEIDRVLHERAARLLEGVPGVTLLLGDARALAPAALAAEGERPVKVAFTYALDEPPAALIAALPEGGRLVAPVGHHDALQELVLWERSGGSVLESEHGAVRYVGDRGR